MDFERGVDSWMLNVVIWLSKVNIADVDCKFWRMGGGMKAVWRIGRERAGRGSVLWRRVRKNL